jgi:hypothetical protein
MGRSGRGMRRAFGILGVVALVTAPMVFAGGSPAGARTAPKLTATTVTGSSASPTRVPAGPYSKLKAFGAGGHRAKFVPTTLTIEPAPQRRCTPRRGGAQIVNRTLINQTITYQGKTVVTIEPNVIALFCAGGPAQFVLGVATSDSTLTLNFR